MKVLVVGSGFGGVKAVLDLASQEGVEVALMTPRLTFEYLAALYRSASGTSPKEVVLPLRDIFGELPVELIQDKIVNIDIDKQMVWGETGESYAYDRLILSIGQVTCFYEVVGVAEHSLTMDTITNTIKLRQHLKELALGDSKRLNVVVVGAGATGVEVASDARNFIAEIEKLHQITPKHVSVTLVEGSTRILPTLSPKLGKVAQKRLVDLGVKVVLDTQVQSCSSNEVTIAGEKLKADAIIWTAGFMNNPFFKDHEGVFKLAKNGRVEVDEYLQAAKNVYVIGDSAQTQYSGMAQTAMFDGGFVAKNIIRELKGKTKAMYVPVRPIYVVPIGPNYAVLQWGSTVLWGKPAWFLRRVADLKTFNNLEPLAKALKTWRAGFTKAKWLDID
jgi:NADH dehydrogenase